MTYPTERQRLKPEVTAFFDSATNTISYIVRDANSHSCAIVDSVLDFDAASGRTSTTSADRIIETVRGGGLQVLWHLETHAHADHLSAAPYLQRELGGEIAIGEHIVDVQSVFGDVFNEGTQFSRDGSQFDRLLKDGESLPLGTATIDVMHTPGHTPACVVYVVGDAAFVGDTIFMPDFGTARCDFPGGSAQQLWQSIQRLWTLPDETRLFMCHDYKAPGRDEYRWETTVREQRLQNKHVGEGATERGFVALREQRDSELSMPRLLLPSVQINMRAGRFPEPEGNGVAYMKLPINAL